MLISVGVLLLLLTLVTRQDSLEDDPSKFEDLTDGSALFEPLPALPDMTNARRRVGPPGISPPPGFRNDLDFDEQMGVLSSHGRTRIVGVSRRKPSSEDEDEEEDEEEE